MNNRCRGMAIKTGEEIMEFSELVKRLEKMCRVVGTKLEEVSPPLPEPIKFHEPRTCSRCGRPNVCNDGACQLEPMKLAKRLYKAWVKSTGHKICLLPIIGLPKLRKLSKYSRK